MVQAAAKAARPSQGRGVHGQSSSWTEEEGKEGRRRGARYLPPHSSSSPPQWRWGENEKGAEEEEG